MAMPDPTGGEPDRDSPALAYSAALLTAALGLVLAAILYPYAGLENVDLVFLTLVVLLALRFGFGPAFLASVASVLAYNFFFIPPVHTFEVAEPKNLAALSFFLLFSLVASQVAARSRAQTVAAKLQARRIEALYGFSRGIGAALGLEELGRSAVDRISALLDRDVFLLLPGADGALRVQAASVPDRDSGTMDFPTIRVFWEGGSWAERKVMRIGDHLFYPLRSEGRVTGLVALSQRSLREALSVEEDSLFEAVAEQLAVAVERSRLAQERDAAQLAAEGERLRDSLFSSLSHDLRTPLASITGAASALEQFPDLYQGEARAELTRTIREEAERMSRFVGNLLDMSRLEAGAIPLRSEPVDLNEIAATALRRAESGLAEHKVEVALAGGLPLMELDPVLVEQAVVNVLDNAAKYAPPGSTVTITSRTAAGGVELTVSDEGPGLPPEDLHRIFDKFYRAKRGDGQRAGTGLGLAIARGFIEANGGTLTAANRSGRSGAVFTMVFPAEARPGVPVRS